MPLGSDPANLIVNLMIAAAAIISVAFAWRAVKTSERNNSIALFVELHRIYHTDAIFAATQTVWEIYSQYQKNTDGTPVTRKQALEFVHNTDRQSREWKATHEITSFWRYLSLLVRQSLLDEIIAFEAFSSPRILGFLYPVEEAYREYHGLNKDYNTSLHRLYDRWKSRKTAEMPENSLILADTAG